VTMATMLPESRLVPQLGRWQFAVLCDGLYVSARSLFTGRAQRLRFVPSGLL